MKTREKRAFSWTTEWGEDGPSFTGQLPSLAVGKDSQEVAIDPLAIEVRGWNRSAQDWVEMGEGISVRIRHWSEGNSRSGRCGANLEVLAPPGASFLFDQICTKCGTMLGLLAEHELKDGRAPDEMCPGCRKDLAEQKALAAEQARENARGRVGGDSRSLVSGRKEGKMRITAEVLKKNFDAYCGKVTDYFAQAYPEGLDISGLWGTWDKASSTWWDILQDEVLRPHVGWAIEVGLLPARIRADLSGADLTGADLHGANMRNVNLTGADLSGADLAGADLRGASLIGADLTGAYLIDADLTGADLRREDLHGAYLYAKDLRGANFVGS